MSEIPTLKNKNLDEMESDFLYHLDINIKNTRDTADIQKLFGDVKVVCMGGTKIRMQKLAQIIREAIDPENKEELVDICEKSNRYAMFKVGPILCCSHGIGMSSFSVVLHELLKLVKYAKCNDPIFMRIGTSGGIGIEPGTVVVSKDGYNGLLRKEYEIAILGKRVCRPAVFSETLANEIVDCGNPSDNFKIVIGNTMGAECFYEGQGRLDGASCEYTAEDKMNYLKRLYELGIRNIEMECPMFASLTHHLNIKAAIVCVTLLDRLNGDQVSISKEMKEDFELRPLTVVTRFIQKTLNKHSK